ATVPITVPSTRKKLLSSIWSRMGSDAAHTVMPAHCGCSSPSSHARSTATQHANAVRKANGSRAASKPKRDRDCDPVTPLLLMIQVGVPAHQELLHDYAHVRVGCP